jgi:hypothetical protein
MAEQFPPMRGYSNSGLCRATTNVAADLFGSSISVTSDTTRLLHLVERLTRHIARVKGESGKERSFGMGSGQIGRTEERKKNSR